MPSDEPREPRKASSAHRTARLEAELRANLRKRKDQARARADSKPGEQGLGSCGLRGQAVKFSRSALGAAAVRATGHFASEAKLAGVAAKRIFIF
jgi:hypothetical protein